jgi:flavodoxin
MKALVVYDSAYGNTAQIAQAIGGALGSPDQVQTLRVGEVSSDQLADLTVLVVGSPTQRFTALPSITSFLKNIPEGALQGVKVATFDTRITEAEIERIKILAFFVKLFGYAAEPIAKRLVQKGGEQVVPPAGFYVGGTEGPLLEGELERAGDWAKQILAAA